MSHWTSHSAFIQSKSKLDCVISLTESALKARLPNSTWVLRYVYKVDYRTRIPFLFGFAKSIFWNKTCSFSDYTVAKIETDLKANTREVHSI